MTLSRNCDGCVQNSLGTCVSVILTTALLNNCDEAGVSEGKCDHQSQQRDDQNSLENYSLTNRT